MTTLVVPLALLLVSLGIVGLVEGWQTMERGLALVGTSEEGEPPDIDAIPVVSGFGAPTDGGGAPSPSSGVLTDWASEGWFSLHRELSA